MLSENYKNALKGFKSQAQGNAPHFSEGCEAETQHIYRIIMSENIVVTELNQHDLETYIEREKSGKADYSKPVDRDGLEYVDFEQDVEIYPVMSNGHQIEGQIYRLSYIDSKSMTQQLMCMGRLTLLTQTIQSLWQRADGTKLLTAFPALNDVMACIDQGLVLPPKLVEKIHEWAALSCAEINFDFVENCKE